MAFRDIVGQERAVAMLRGLLQQGRIASSYLFCGEKGIGKKMAAINLARALNCRKAGGGVRAYGDDEGMFPPSHDASRGASPDACDVCDSCLKIASGTHPDLLQVSPEDRQIRIEEIRLIDEALSFKPFEGRMKAVVVDDAELMNIAAANAFLKTLEEPPARSVIILVSSRPELLPATIRSRCSRINFSPLSSEACGRVLRGKVPEGTLETVARLAMGRPGLALATDLAGERDWFLDHFRGMLRAEKDGWSSREDMERWFDSLLIFLRDLAVFKITGSAGKLINSDLGEEVSRLAQLLEVKGIIYLYKEFSSLKAMFMFNLNKSVTWNFAASLLRKELAA